MRQKTRTRTPIAIADHAERRITVGELREHLNVFPDDWEITFGGLDFYRTKARGEKLVQIEFNQTVYRDEKGRVVVENHDL